MKSGESCCDRTANHVVIETRRTRTAIRRRWQCRKHGKRWSTWEPTLCDIRPFPRKNEIILTPLLKAIGSWTNRDGPFDGA